MKWGKPWSAARSRDIGCRKARALAKEELGVKEELRLLGLFWEELPPIKTHCSGLC